MSGFTIRSRGLLPPSYYLVQDSLALCSILKWAGLNRLSLFRVLGYWLIVPLKKIEYREYGDLAIEITVP